MKLLFIVNVDWFFISHRLPIALQAIKNGYDVHIACGITDKQKELESLGLIVHKLPLSRSGTSVLNELLVLHALWKVISFTKPDLVQLVTIKGVIYGGLVTRFFNVKNRVASISGLGFVFIHQSFKAKALRFLVTKLYRFALNDQNTTVIFQNENDQDIFVNNKIISKQQSLLIRGSGVDLNKFQLTPEPSETKVVMFLARLLKDKGLVEFCEAANLLSDLADTKFVIVGDLDPDNPNSLSRVELDNYIQQGHIEHWGYSANVEQIIPLSHIMVLPSYREGLPKSLLEAAACGRAVVTTDVPGCRDAITPDVTGLLVPAKDVEKLAEAIKELLVNDNKRLTMAAAGRELAERAFDVNDVVQKHMIIYEGKL